MLCWQKVPPLQGSIDLGDFTQFVRVKCPEIISLPGLGSGL
jgi:hypothetical protein